MTDTSPETPRRRIKSFILRQGRYTTAQKNALDNHWKHYGIEPSETFINFDQVFQRSAPVTLEIGFGNGDSLLQQAIKQPENNFIGIEVHGPGIGHLIHRVHENQLKNLRVIRADAVEVLSKQIPENSLERLQLFFPDPWHKKKHNKRRIVQAEFIELVHRKLQTGGYLHMATDWQHYARQMLNTVDSNNGFSNCAGKGNFSSDKGARAETKFERRGINLGHGIWDIMHIKRG